MKAKFLKIAGVKNESEFYKKYPTEAAFFKAHPEAKKEVKKAQVGENVKVREVETIPSGYSFFKKDELGRELYRISEEKKKSASTTAGKKSSVAGKTKAPAPKKSVVKTEDIVYIAPKQTPVIKETTPQFDKSSYREEPVYLDKKIVGNVYYPTTRTSTVKSEGNLNVPYQPAVFRSRDDWSTFTGTQFDIEPEMIQKIFGTTNTVQNKELFDKYFNKAKSKFQTGGNIGEFVGGDVTDFQPINFQEVRDQQDLILTGMTDEMRKEEAYKQQMLQAEKQQAAKDSKNMLGNLLGNIMGGGGSGVTSGGATAEDVSQLAKLSGKKGAKIKKGKGGFQQFVGNMGGPMGIADAAQNIIRGIQMLKEQKEALRTARQASAVSDVALQAASTRPEETRRIYGTPDLIGPNQAFMSYGTGTNFLQAEDGAMIGGNPTEIQNMYNPGTLYSDLGFEPLQDSDRVKQYKRGGYLPMAQGGFNLKSFADKGGFDVAGQFANIIPGVGQDAGSSIGAGVGEIAGSLIPIPGMRKVGRLAGELIGGLVDRSAEKMEKEQKKQQKNLSQMAMQQGARAIQGQYSGFVRNGGDVPMGEHGWVSHDWQPQVITKFGEYDVKDLLKPPADADMLRTGGNLRQNYVDPEEQMAFGGEMKTHWGGYAEPISQNPYLPGTGETVMFRGQSHDESDGKGRTGIGVSYGPTGNDAYTDYAEYGTKAAENKVDVEVERGEPAIELPSGNEDIQPLNKFAAGGQQTSMVVYGNLMVPKQSISEIGDPSLSHNKPIKFKNLVKKYSEQEEKANKKIDKATSALDNITPVTSLDKLALNTQNVIIDAENEKLKRLAQYKMNAAALQQAINKTAEEMGVDADALAKGKVKIDKKAQQETARFGKEIFKAQGGEQIKNLQNLHDALGIDPSTPGYGKKIGPKTIDAYKKFYFNYMINLPPQNGYSYKDLSWDSVNKISDEYIKDLFFKDGKIKITEGYADALGLTTEGNKKNVSKTPLILQSAQNAQSNEFFPIDRKMTEVPSNPEDVVMPPFSRETFSQNINTLANRFKQFQKEKSIAGNFQIPAPQQQTSPKVAPDPEGKDKKESVYDYLKALSSQLTPLLNRPIQEQLDPSQILGELTALGTNQLQPVQAQTFQPLLAARMSNVSLQDQLNANQADFNALQRILGYNPAALSQLAAQKYAANSKVLADQFRMNQQMENEVINKNRELLNDAQLKNLAILDQQYTRQEQARSNTKATFQEAMNSIASKTLQNKLENRTLATYSNFFPQYGFTPDMMARQRGLTFFPISNAQGTTPSTTTDTTTVKTKNGGKTKKHSTNASILKMYKG